MKCYPSLLFYGLCMLLAMAALPGCNGDGSDEGCPEGLSDCDGLCRDVQVDPSNCGSCGNVCGTGEICSDGTCTLTCPAGFTDCGGTCVNLDSDHDHCGGCSDACSADEVCSGGECMISCPTGTTDCSGSCVDTDTDPFNCGGCGQPCYRDEDCVDGECTAATTCGDGIVDGREACDDGNDDNTDACLDTCENASCGDGFVQTGVEECDDGNADNDDACLTTCLEASCGDGFVQTGLEDCDDGNTTNRDGCSEYCIEELSCLVTHNGGNPARLSSLSVDSNGQMAILDSVTVSGSHSGRGAQSIAACGGWIYALMSGSDQIQMVTVAMDGTLTAGGTTSFTDVWGLLCDPYENLLLAYAVLQPGRMEVRSYTLDASGQPVLADSQTFTMSIGSYEIVNSGMLQHPVSHDLWLLAVWSDSDMTTYGLRGARISYGPTGTLTTEQFPTEISQEVFLAMSFTLSPDGSELVMTSYNIGCIAWYDLSGTGLPVRNSEIEACSETWDYGLRAAVRDGSNIFYLTYLNETTIRIGEFGFSGPVDRGTATAAAQNNHVQLLYDDSVLVSLSRSGSLRSFTSSTDGISLTVADNASLGTTPYLDSSVVVACTP